MKNISLIGCTGSIGRQVIQTVERHPDKFRIVAMAGGRQSGQFKSLVEKVKPDFFAVAESDKNGALAVASYDKADVVFNAAGGFSGLEYSFEAVKAKKTLALANKETLVCGGSLLIPLAQKNGVEVIPVDSEHSAIWQCLAYDRRAKVNRLVITASGGAFGDTPFEKLKDVTVEQALNHPTWKMGKKITIDSATLMNKGYEVIEAHELYGVPYENIETVIQPQSIVHSLVGFDDGAYLAQLSYPTMSVPIQLALTYPERFETGLRHMDFSKAFSIDFRPLVRKNYPCFDIALTCGERGGTAPCVLNAADEVAVNAFLEKKIAFTDIYRVIAETVDGVAGGSAESFEQLVSADYEARLCANKIIDRF